MSLTPGTRLGPYEILAPLGAGGMGVVYRARDTRLDRIVAIKVLSSDFASDPAARERFDREARAISQLAHAHICTLYDVGREGDTAFLVMEHLEGRTLRAVMESGPIPTRRAMDWAGQIAEGLTAAHEKGIVHRDLKPENVFVTDAGPVKILDFGLAKVAEAAGLAGGGTGLTRSETMPGMLLGTVGYMSPEQVRGGAVDHRTDIFSLGVVLYEMLSGQRAFVEATPADTLSAILSKEPADLPAGSTNAALDLIVRRCLDKNAARRFASASDVGFALQAAGLSSGSAIEATPRLAPRWRGPVAAAVALVASTAAISYLAMRVPATPLPPPLRFTLSPPQGTTLGTSSGTPSFGVSPDGRHVALIVERNSRSVLAVHALDAFEGVVFEETEEARAPFWSPDSRSIGFFAGRQLKKVAASGGSPEIICELAIKALSGSDLAATWAPDGTILVAGVSTQLLKVPADGGTPAAATPQPSVEGDERHLWPQFLPDGRHFLFVVRKGVADVEAGLYMSSIGGGAPERIREAMSRAVYVEPGFLLSVRQGTLGAQGFDWRRRSFSSAITPVARNISFTVSLRSAFSGSNAGVLVYRSQQAVSRLSWASRQGDPGGFIGPAGDYVQTELSPDGQTIALEVHSTDASGQSEGNIWVVDTARGIFSKLTFDNGEHSTSPVWAPDGTAIAYRHSTEVRVVPVTAAPTARVVATGADVRPTDWTSDGSIVYVDADPKTSDDIWVTPATGGGRSVRFAGSAFNENQARVSADGKWIAYTSDESGAPEVYVRPFPSGSGKWRVSTSGGRGPRWRGDGAELFFLGLDGRLMAVPVRTARAFDFDVARPLFDARTRDRSLRADYDVTPDGQRFLLNEPVTSGAALNVITNWRAVIETGGREPR